MKLASHNTMTYLTPTKLWMRVINFTAKCQDKPILTQWNNGARLFDLRIRFDKKNNPLFAHGLVEYKGGNDVVINALKQINNLKCPTRLFLELSNRDDRQEQLFKEFCERVASKYTEITFFGGTNRNGKLIYYFGNRAPSIKGGYSSDNGGKLNDLYPWLYAKHNNKRHKNTQYNTDYLMLDFIEIG